jgi:thioredoxin 1
MSSLILYVLGGAGIGAVLGHFSRSAERSSRRPWSWWRGAFYGAGFGVISFMLSGGSSSMNQSTRDVTRIAESEFEAEVAKSALPVVVDFYATWCGPCRSLAPIVDEVAGQFAGKVKFVKVNIDEAPALARRFGIRGVPTLLFLRNGEVVDSQIGLLAPAALNARVASLAATSSATAAKP